MSKRQQLIKECKELANKGAFQENILKDVIKSDFLDNLPLFEKRMDLYAFLAIKYGKSTKTIRNICN